MVNIREALITQALKDLYLVIEGLDYTKLEDLRKELLILIMKIEGSLNTKKGNA